MSRSITYVQSKNQIDVYNKIIILINLIKNNNIRRVWGTINEMISKSNKKESCIKTIAKEGKWIRRENRRNI